MDPGRSMERLSDSLLPEELAELRNGLLQHPPVARMRSPARNRIELRGPEAAVAVNSPQHPRHLQLTSPSAGRDDSNARRTAPQLSHAIPRLNPSNTAPSLQATIGETPSNLRMYHSFNDFADAAGDTQPMDSQVYKPYTSNLVEEDDTVHTIGETSPAKTVTQGDTGHIDIVGNWEQDLLKEQTSPVSFAGDAVELSPVTQFEAQPTSPFKFIPPETPALAGNKRTYRGEVISSDTKTPALATFFPNVAGSGGPNLSLTQLFNATQVGTSPLQGAPRSDPVFERPSPNFTRRSSPPPPTSSPTKLMRSDHLRSATEPLDTYVTMKESQELREARKRAEAERQLHIRSEGFGSDEELTAAERAVARRMRQAKIDTQARKGMEGLTAPQRHQKHRRTKSTGISSDAMYITPARSGRKSRRTIEVSNDVGSGESTDDESMDELAALPSSSVKSMKSTSSRANGVQVPMTSSRPDASHKGISTRRNPSPGEEDELSKAEPLSQSQRASQNSTMLHKASNTVAVADSQPETQGQNHAQPPQLVEPSSLESNLRISQSQYSASGRTKEVRLSLLPSGLNTSSVPPPPLDTSQSVADRPIQEDEQVRMPSSPPILQSSGLAPERRNGKSADSDEEVDLVGAMENDEDQRDASEPPSPSIRQRARSSQRDKSVISSSEEEMPSKRLKARRTRSSIPETDPAEDPASSVRGVSVPLNNASVDRISHPPAADKESNNVTDTNSTGIYETAQTHASASPRKGQLLSEANKSKRVSPMRIRKLTEIAAEKSSMEESLADIDMDINIMTAEDEQFHQILSGSSPINPTKRRKKVYSAKRLRSPLKESISAPARSSSPPSAPEDDELGLTLMAQPKQSAMFAKPAAPGKPAEPKNGKLSRPSRQRGNLTPLGKHAAPATVGRKSGAAPKLVNEIAETPQSRPGEAPNDTISTMRVSAPSKTSPALEERGPRKRQPVDQIEDQTMEDIGQPVGDHANADDLLTPRRVLAVFRGLNMAYFPATCLGLSHGDKLQLTVRFDDGTVDHLEPQHVKALDIRVDDLVKVDLAKMRTHTYIVSGFKDKITPTEMETEQYPLTDQCGYKTVILRVKPRESLPKGKQIQPTETVDVPMTSIYLTTTMWNRTKDRVYIHPGEPSRFETPDQRSVPATPISRSRRTTVPSFAPSVTRAASTASSAQITSNLFANMAFCVTFLSPSSTDRDTITNLITSHGGRILEPGFEVLFNIPEPGTLDAAISPANPPTTTVAGGVTPPFALTKEAETLGFVALITDRHSRRAKYMQALGLNLPCLSARWVRDSIAAATPMPWLRYLLPAGESAFLDGAVRSRYLVPYAPADAKLKAVIEGRERLLGGGRVVLVLGEGGSNGKGKARKAGWERKRQYMFLSYALGATRVEGVRDLDAVRDVLEEREPQAEKAKGEGGEEGWVWVYVDAERLAEAERVLFRDGSAAATDAGAPAARKRRRTAIDEDDAAASLVVKSGVVNDRKVKIAGDEFVVQSLILGALMEE